MINAQTKEKNSSDIHEEIELIRVEFLKHIIHATLILSLITIPFATISIIQFNFRLINFIHLLALITSIILTVYNKKISFNYKSYCISFLFIGIAIITWVVQGVNGMGVLWFFLSCLILISFFGVKTTSIFTVSFIIFAMAISLYQVSNFDQYLTQLIKQQSEPSYWFARIITVSTITIFFTYALYHLQNNLYLLIKKVSLQKDQIEHLANHDQLTGLPTLRIADERLSMAISLASRNNRIVGVLFLDLDKFKKINDTYGHQAGDSVLRTVALRLKEQCRQPDTICRIGGDEFFIVLADMESEANIEKICQRLVSCVAEPISYEDKLLSVGVSIGVSLFPHHSTDLVELKKMADQTMYKVKKSGKNNYLIKSFS